MLYLIKPQLKKLIEEGNFKQNDKSNIYLIKLFSNIFTGMQGRYTRLKIILALADNPLNTYQLSKYLEYDYKSIKRNLEILEKNNLIESSGKYYGRMFFTSELIMNNLPTLLQVVEQAEKRLNRKKKYIL